MKLFSNRLNPVILVVIGLFFLSCSSDKIPQDEIVAKVGNKIITAKEFAASYEFSFQTLRIGPNPRKTYLDFMIKELLIANEGYANGFNNHKYVTKRLKTRTNKALLESFYTKYVYNKVNVPEDKIIDALKKASIKFRLLILPTPSLEKAAIAYDSAVESDLGDYIDKQLDKLEIKNTSRKNFETDWLDYMEMPPDMFDQIKNLEIGVPSKPIPYQNGYAIFQVIDIQREAIKSDELKYGPKRKKMYARLFNIESDKIVHKLMDSILTPMNVKVSNKTVDKMVEPLFEWLKQGLPKRGTIVNNLKSVTDTSAAYLIQLKNLLTEQLLTTNDGVKTVEDYFEYMNYYRKVINQSSDLIDLKNRLLTEIGTMIKNDKFIDIAKNEGFLDSASVKEDLNLWEEKWTYDIYRAQMTKDIEITNEEMQKFFKERWRELRIADVDTTRFYKYEDDVYNFIKYEKHMALLNVELEKLKEKYDVWINEDVLNNLKLNDDSKSSETSVIVIKNFSGELLVPTADPTWLTY